jgi:DNA-binding SARP family transcriptional activator
VFRLRVAGHTFNLPHSVEKVVAFLALAGRPVSRARLAGTLWPDTRDLLAAKSLRTALWRLHRAGAEVVSTYEDRVELVPGVPVDVRELTMLANLLLQRPIPAGALGGLSELLEQQDLLPDWDEDWVVVDRERFRLSRLEALESAATELLTLGRLAEAVIVASAAVESEPLRESARRLVVRAQVEQGNLAEALRSYRQYRSLLRAEFGLHPTPAMAARTTPLGRSDDAGPFSNPASLSAI